MRWIRGKEHRRLTNVKLLDAHACIVLTVHFGDTEPADTKRLSIVSHRARKESDWIVELCLALTSIPVTCTWSDSKSSLS